MAKVFVHGNPETSAIWGRLVAGLAERGIDDVRTLSPPGFGAPVPQGFEPHMDNYRTWLIAALEAIGEPVDIVGHDWGAGHVMGVAAARPDLLRTWATDCGGLAHPDFVWHSWARAWQTPIVGEAAIAATTVLPVARKTARMAGLGMPPDVAAAVGAALNKQMGACILGLYRSAIQPAMADLGRRVAAAERRPALILIPTEDRYPGTPEMAQEVADAVGANTVRLEGREHWWMFADLDPVVDALIAHWDR